MTIKKKARFKKSYDDVAAHIVLGTDFKSSLEKLGIQAPIHVFTTTVDREVLESFDLNQKNLDSPKILFLSRIEKVKGIYECLEIFREISADLQDATLFVAGDGSELEGARQFVLENKINNVEFLGYIRIKQKLELLKSCNIYLFPTFHPEGLPITVLEAMAFGMPIVTRPMGGLNDLINDQIGFKTMENNNSLFTNYILNLFADKTKLKSISEHNYRFSRENFHPDITVKRLYNVYTDCLN